MPRVWNRSQLISIPPGAVLIDRTTRFGNPYRIGPDGTRTECIAQFERDTLNDPEFIELIRNELCGRDLVCWCWPKPCHGDVLLRIANELTF